MFGHPPGSTKLKGCHWAQVGVPGRGVDPWVLASRPGHLPPWPCSPTHADLCSSSRALVESRCALHVPPLVSSAQAVDVCSRVLLESGVRTAVAALLHGEPASQIIPHSFMVNQLHKLYRTNGSAPEPAVRGITRAGVLHAGAKIIAVFLRPWWSAIDIKLPRYHFHRNVGPDRTNAASTMLVHLKY